MSPSALAHLRRRAGFPWTAPPWPGSAERPAAPRRTGVDYDTAWARREPARFARGLALEAVARPVVRALAAPRVEGLDRLEGLSNPVVFAANHASHADTPLLLTALPERFRHRTAVAAGADYFFDARWKAAFWAFATNAIPIERTRISPRSTRLALEVLGEGWSLAIYPEGGRSPDGWGQPHRAGAAYLAVRTGVPVVPVHLGGTRRLLPKGARLPSPAATTVSFGRPLRAGDGEDARALARRVELAVAVLADEQATDWWSARRRAAQGATPALTGPPASPWRRAWALAEGRRSPAATGKRRRWPT